MELPDFTTMTAEQKTAWRREREAQNARRNKIVVATTSCPYCYAEPGSSCRATRWAKTPRKVSIHQSRRDAWIDSGSPLPGSR